MPFKNAAFRNDTAYHYTIGKTVKMIIARVFSAAGYLGVPFDAAYRLPCGFFHRSFLMLTHRLRQGFYSYDFRLPLKKLR
jgi:hypothetical protein